MEAIFNKDGRLLSVKVSGRLDTISSNDLMAKVKETLDDNVRDVVVDCSELTYISSSGLRVLMTIYKQTVPYEGSLTLRNLTQQVGEVLNITGMANLFTIE